MEAARLLLARLGVSPTDLLGPAIPRRLAPTFAAYVPVVAEGVGAGTRRGYGSYWNRIAVLARQLLRVRRTHTTPTGTRG